MQLSVPFVDPQFLFSVTRAVGHHGLFPKIAPIIHRETNDQQMSALASPWCPGVLSGSRAMSSPMMTSLGALSQRSNVGQCGGLVVAHNRQSPLAALAADAPNHSRLD